MTATSVDPLVTLTAIIGVGVLLGRIRWGGMSLGTSAILFVALLAGHLGGEIPEGVGRLGLVAFVYGVGITAGPSFFRGLARDGMSMAVLSVVVVLTGAVTTWGVTRFADLPPPLAGGLFAGAMTSTPALGAVTDATGGSSDVAVGFGVAYPLGVVGVVLFVQILGRQIGEGDGEASGGDSWSRPGHPEIRRWLVEVQNPSVVGKRPSGVSAIAVAGCQVSRVVHGNRLEPIGPDFTFELGQQVLVVAAEHDAVVATEVLGRMIERDDTTLDEGSQRRHVVVTSPDVVGKSLRELRLLSRFGITIARVRRYDVQFVPSSETILEFGDTLTVVGQPEPLREFGRVAGHRPKVLDETDIVSLAAGMLIGLGLGSIRVEAFGQSVSLGLAGGPLVAGLVLAHFRRIGPIVGHVPIAARTLLLDGGLALFLADAGVGAGSTFTEVLGDYGPKLLVAAAVIGVAPMIVAATFGRYVLRMSPLRLIGAACGALTSTPGLAAVTGKTDSSVPVISYVAAYPVALTLVTLIAPALIRWLMAS